MSNVVALDLPGTLPKILLAEDSPSDALLIKKLITRALPTRCAIHHENTLEATLKALRGDRYDVVLLDLSLPDCMEFDGLLSIQNAAPTLPIIILTAYADEELALKAVQRGAQDYLFKDRVDGKSIQRAMQFAVQRKQFEATLINQANFDTLTGMANRALFESRLDMALARSRRSPSGFGLFFLDLNRFKQVNDTLGHAMGDKLLIQVSERLKQCVRPYDTVARLGGDEFALLVEGITQPRDCAAIAQKIIQRVAEPFMVARKNVEVGVSIGIATGFPGGKDDRATLMLHADEAMYSAKMSYASSYRFYTPQIHEEACARLRLEGELRDAVEKGELMLHYQPKINLETGGTTGAEALLRWNHPVRGLLLPAEFMAIAEEVGMEAAIGQWVLVAVCDDIARWKKASLPAVRISVNICAAQLDEAAWPCRLREMLAFYQIDPGQLIFELPSSALLECPASRIMMLEEIHALGIGVHLDHFGTSAVSLASLKSLPLNGIKISPTLTSSLNESNDTLALVQAILDIAARFGMPVVATGIENSWQRAFFKERGCGEGQGFALCRPVPGAYMPDWLDNKKS